MPEMSRLEAIKLIIATADYSIDDEVLQHIRCILDGQDPQVEIDSLRQREDESQKDHESLRLWL